MKKKTGEKLFTIEFSSSYEYEEEDLPPRKKTPQPSPKRSFFPKPAAKIKNPKPDLGGLVEISDESYEYSDHPISNVKKVIPSNNNEKIDSSSDDQAEKDVFTITDTKKRAEKSNHNYNKITIDPKSVISDQDDNYDDQNDNDYDQNDNEDVKNDNDNDQNDNGNDQNDYSEEGYSEGNRPNNENLSNSGIVNNDSKDQITALKSPPPQSLPVQVPPAPETSDSPVYLITREKKTHINGRRLFFNIYLANQQICIAKCKTKNASHVYVAKGNDVHIGSGSDAVILIGNDGADFSLRKKEDLGNEILTIRILPPAAADTSRKMTVSFFAPLKGTPKKIFAKKPNLGPDGKVEHELDGFAIMSIKNAVLVEKQGGPNMLIIRKTGSDSIEIVPKFQHDVLWIFAIGIASFLSKVKGIK